MSDMNFVSNIPGLVVGVTYADTSTSMSHQSSLLTGVYAGYSIDEIKKLIVEDANKDPYYGHRYNTFEEWETAYHYVVFLSRKSDK